mgnify:CR=1 FL=1
MKRIKLALIWKVLIACVLGSLLGYVLPEPVIRIFTTFNYIFSQYIGFIVPLIIVGLVTPAICKMGASAGKLLLLTIALAYFSTVAAGVFSYGVSVSVFPSLLGELHLNVSRGDADGLEPFFTLDIPAIMNVTSALVLSFLVGTLLTVTGKDHLKNVIYDFEEVITLAIAKTLIPLLPVYIFGIFLKMGAEGKVVAVLGMFLKMILVIFAMHVTVLLVQFCIAGAVARKNPFRALWNMLPAYLTALGTQSSAATIPVTHAQTLKNGVDPDVADFVIPLCATIHLSCSMLKIVACAYAVSLSMGMDISMSTYLGFIFMLAITMVAAPGVPGGAIMAALGLLSSILGFDANLQGLMIALYIAMDSFGTAGNVTGDGAIALIVNKIKPMVKNAEV